MRVLHSLSPQEPELPDLGASSVVVQPPRLPGTFPRGHRLERDRDLCQRRLPEFYLEREIVAQLQTININMTLTVTKQMCNKYCNYSKIWQTRSKSQDIYSVCP